MKPFQFKSVRTKLTFWFNLIALLPLASVMALIYFNQLAELKKENFEKIVTIRDLKVGQLLNWLDERSSNMETLVSYLESTGIEQLTKENAGLNDYKKSQQNIRRVIQHFNSNYLSYDEVFILHPETGIKVASTKSYTEGEDKHDEVYFTEPIKTRKMFIRDVYYSTEIADYAMSYSVPIFENGDEAGRITGILVARIDLESTLFKLLLNRTGLGNTGETLIVDRNVTALNELRWFENAPLNLKISALPAVQASQGNTGVAFTKDYRGVKVLAAFTFIPETGWGFVSKQDVAEINAPAQRLLLYLFLFFLFTAGVVGLIVFWLGKTIAGPILHMDQTAKRINSGDYSAQNIVISSDELGSLALTMNNMTRQIVSQINIQTGISEISETLLAQNEINSFAQQLLRKLMKTIGALMGAFYVLNENNSLFEPYMSVGINSKALRNFSSDKPEGEFAQALLTGKISHIKDIPGNTRFTFNSATGNLLPNDIITIPIIVDSVIVAVVSLFSIRPVEKEEIEILEHSWQPINTFYSNLLANERTRTLAESMAKMNHELEAQSDELQQQTEELMQQNYELEIQRKQIEQANRLKSEFLSNMSHELRTPLNSVNALSQVLSMTAGSKLNEDENNYLQIINRNGKHLLSLINDILDLSKIEAGRIEITLSEVSVKGIVSRVAEVSEPLAIKRGIKLEYEIAADVDYIETDESKLSQILLNILGNAIKFTEKGTVNIKAKNENSFLLLEISDTGIGISEKDLPYIFDEFRQVDGSSSRNYEGTGLGLAIVKKLTETLGGIIRVKSIPGEGSVFTVEIPLKFKYTEKSEIKTVDKFPDTNLNSQTKQILVVDDNLKTALSISNYLKEAGFDTFIATDGKEALKMAEKYQPFAITLDIIMPGLDGFEVLQKLKENSVTQHIPVVMVSVSDDSQTGFALGAVGYINKPVEKDILIREINHIQKHSKTILITDDNPFELDQIAHILREAKYKVLLAHSGEECLECLKKDIPDLLILDLIMPGMDGFEVLDEIRSNPDTQNLPVIIVTAKELSDQEKIRLRGRVITVITKGKTNHEQLNLQIEKIIREIQVSKPNAKTEKYTQNPTILMVEDNFDAVIQVKTLLEKSGYNIDVAKGGKQAVEYVNHKIPDGIILDLMMPEMDGFAVLETIRNTPATRNIPVLILTAKDLSAEDLSRLSSNNIQQLIHKGDIDTDGLLFKVRLMLGNQPRYPETQKNKSVLHNETSVTYKPVNPQIQSSPKIDNNEIEESEARQLPFVLVVEDNKDNMTTIKAILNGKCQIEEAFDGEKGLESIKRKIPDLILLDMSLPKMSGERFTEIVKSDEKLGKVPIIAVTAHNMVGDRERFLNSGCNDFVAKPIAPEELLEKISYWLKK